MKNPLNLKPDERVDEMLTISNQYGRIAIISYLLDELANNSQHKNFSDECYWKEVREEFNSRLKYDN
jgi:hypothetical protein